MYQLNRETEIALMEVAVMHPHTSIDELLMMWVYRYYDELAEGFSCYFEGEEVSTE